MMRELRAGSKWRYGCILAKSTNSASYDGRESPAISLLDLWTFRVSEIDPLQLPFTSGHVTVWDDLFSKRELENHILEVLLAIPNYDFAGSSAYRLQLDRLDCLQGTITGLLDDARFPRGSRRIAVVDLCSVGVGPLEWRDILPCLRCRFGLIVGIASIIGLGFADHDRIFGEDGGFWSQLSAEMEFCDLTLLTSDGLLGFSESLRANVRAAYLTNLVDELNHTLVSQDREARREFATCSNIDVIEAPIDDIWMRDIAPTFAKRNISEVWEVIAIDWNFNDWGGGGAEAARSKASTADLIATVAGVPRYRANFCAEGGAFMFCGQRIAITTRSCLLNPNRNPVVRGIDRQRLIEVDLHRFGIDNVIWLEGDPFEPVSSGHVDGYLLVGSNGTILVEHTDDPDIEGPMWRDHDTEVLRRTMASKGQRCTIRRVLAPRCRYWKEKSESFAPAYLNAYVANGAVIGAAFCDPQRDTAAKAALRKAFPRREIVLLQVSHLAKGGGGIHCLTQPMPAA